MLTGDPETGNQLLWAVHISRECESLVSGMSIALILEHSVLSPQRICRRKNRYGLLMVKYLQKNYVLGNLKCLFLPQPPTSVKAIHPH